MTVHSGILIPRREDPVSAVAQYMDSSSVRRITYTLLAVIVSLGIMTFKLVVASIFIRIPTSAKIINGMVY